MTKWTKIQMWKRKKEREAKMNALSELGLLEEYLSFKGDSERECFARFAKSKGISLDV